MFWYHKHAIQNSSNKNINDINSNDNCNTKKLAKKGILITHSSPSPILPRHVHMHLQHFTNALKS